MHVGIVVTNVFALFLIYALSIPIICIYTYRFYQRKSHPMMQHRDVSFVLSLNWLIAFGLMTHRTITILSHLQIIRYPLLIQRFFTAITVFGTIDLICVKSYLSYFQHQHYVSIQDISWKKHIDSSWIDWYLQNKNKWGKFSYLIRWILIPFAITVIIECLGKTILGWLFMFIYHVVAVFVPILLVIFFCYRPGGFYDIYGIRKEILFQLIAILIIGIVYFITSFIIKKLLINPYWEVQSIPGNFVPTIAFSIVAISSVCYPLYLLRQQSVEAPEDAKSIRLLRSIKDATMLSLFMQHSVREFNTENLLFIIECVQIKHEYQIANRHIIRISNNIPFQLHEHKDSRYLVVDMNGLISTDPKDEKEDGREDNTSDIITYLLCDELIKVQIPSELPKSTILTTYPDDIRSQVAALYHKYVKDESHLEINLPFALKRNLCSLVTTRDDESNQSIEGDWFCALDQSCLHILTLLNAPFRRFKKTGMFKRYIQSKEYQTMVKSVDLIDIDFKNKLNVYDGSRYDELIQTYATR